MLVKQHAKKLPLPIFLFVAFSTIIGITLLLLSLFFSDTSPNLTRVPYAADEKVLLLFWSKLWGFPAKKSEGFLEKGIGKDQCPVSCEVTSNRDRIKQAHAFIVHARDPYPLPPNRDIPWILTTLENPVYTPVLKKPEYMSQVHLLRSYRLDSDFPTPLFKKPNLDPPVPFKNKTGRIMAAFSNCEPVRTRVPQTINEIYPGRFLRCMFAQ
ncbi:Hypothetical predicted protein [Paramuricea clavata]|uniref:Fucosyltransferase N-terminal domain-containing protein n=1 Tax=Paramuricea clavata TaxID=317549 RepID=A0A7D9E894_PARCT|nr:Hypothetical predicted protein [Paramuricea clavata]